MPAALQFGVYELDPQARELRRAGVRVAIQPQPLTVLIALAERPGQVVSRAEVRELLWGAHTHVDFERGLNFCMAQIRVALRDSARSPRFVETLPRRGYRLIAPVRMLESTPHRRRPWRVVAVTAAAVVLASTQWFGPGTVVPGGPRAPAASAAPSAALVKGLYHAGGGPEALPEAIRWLEEAVQDAPADVRAGVALARVYYRAAEAQVRAGRLVFPRARAVAAAAVERDPDNAEAHLWHALARLYGDWDWAGGGDELRQAAALDPRSVQARRALAGYLSAIGDDEGALLAIEDARRLDPVCLAVTADHAQYLYRARRFDEAGEAWNAILEVRDDPAPHEGLFLLHRTQGRLDRAKEDALRVMALVGVPAPTRDMLSRRPSGEAVRSFLSGALAHLARPGTGAGPERLAVLRAALGEADPALALLEQGCRDHSPDLPRTLRDPAFDALRGSARFQRVRDCVGLRASEVAALDPYDPVPIANRWRSPRM